MKRIILIVALIATLFMQKTFAQDTSMQSVITDYLNLKNALTKDNADSAKANASMLNADFKKVAVENLSKDQKKIWLQNYEALVNNSTIIANTTDISAQRKQFNDLSSNFYKLVKGMKTNTSDLLYEYCPMADAYWVSENSKIVNPYFGKKMLSCGSVRETLKANK